MRARALGLAPGLYRTGQHNAITDVDGVLVGHVTLTEGEDIRTGVSVIIPHNGNIFQNKLPAAVAIANGFGKFVGSTQVNELGEIETPIALTNTLSAPTAAQALIDWTLRQAGNEHVRSVNPIVGETNDGILNNIRRRVVTCDDVLRAIDLAQGGEVDEGAVGAGTGTVTFGYKGGIGTSSRELPPHRGGFMIGALVQSNYGGALRLGGGKVDGDVELGGAEHNERAASADGSIVIVIATDAPLSDRNLGRLARRAFAGLARTGSAFSNGSGDYAIAFSTAAEVRRTPERRSRLTVISDLPNDLLSPLFVAAADAVEEAIYNSLFQAMTMTSRDAERGVERCVKAIDLDLVRQILGRSRQD